MTEEEKYKIKRNWALVAAFDKKHPAPAGYNCFDSFQRNLERERFVSGYEYAKESMKCCNCRHWRDKAWTDKGWGICDNPKNESRVSPLGMITNYMRNLPDPEKDQMIEELVAEIENSIRYPADFGCIFFEALEGS